MNTSLDRGTSEHVTWIEAAVSCAATYVFLLEGQALQRWKAKAVDCTEGLETMSVVPRVQNCKAALALRPAAATDCLQGLLVLAVSFLVTFVE